MYIYFAFELFYFINGLKNSLKYWGLGIGDWGLGIGDWDQITFKI